MVSVLVELLLPIPILTFANGKGNIRVQLPIKEAIIEGVMWIPESGGRITQQFDPNLHYS